MTETFLKTESCSLIGKETIEYIIQAGAQAPSYLNCQPWKFKIINNVIELYLDDQNENTVINWKNMSSLIACGAVIENMKIASSFKGCDSFVEILPKMNEDQLIARIVIKRKADLEKNEADTDLNYALWMRHTNASMYENKSIEDKLLIELSNAVKLFPEVSINFIRDEGKKKNIFNTLYYSELIRYSRTDLHKNFHKMIRWVRKPALTDKTGYTLGSMGLCKYGKLFFKMTKPWYINKFINYFGACKNSAKQGSNGLLNCGAIGNIAIKGKSNIELIKGGMAIQRLWLVATKLKLDLQPHMTYSLLDWARGNGGENNFSKKELSLLNKSSEEFQQAFPSDETSIFLFRIGYGKPVAGRTFRKKIG